MIALFFKFTAVFIVSYLIGSIPTGYIIVKLLKNIDIREVGSGSTGATNVKRVLGTKWFFIVMLLDALKGYIPVILTVKFFDFNNVVGLSPVLSALGIVIGHSKSIFLKFTGGKSVASGIGTIFALSFPSGALIAVIWSIITYFTKYVSLGSIIAVALAPVLMKVFGGNHFYILYSSLCAVYVIIRHKDNIKRLINGSENKVR